MQLLIIPIKLSSGNKCSPASRIILLPADWDQASAVAGGGWRAERDSRSLLTKAGAGKKKRSTPLVTWKERGSAFLGRFLAQVQLSGLVV